MPNEPTYYCTRCGEKLNPKTKVLLELNWETNLYSQPGEVPEDKSQGCFDFGVACARRVMKQGGDCDYVSSKTFSRRNKGRGA